MLIDTQANAIETNRYTQQKYDHTKLRIIVEWHPTAHNTMISLRLVPTEITNSSWNI